jgi:predicted acetyltransferase
MDLKVRPVRDDEYRAYGLTAARGFGVDYDEEDQDRERELIPIENTLAAFSGEQLVGTEGMFAMTLAIPGARVPMAGITTVSVLPTHHRRGVLTAIMRRRLDGLHATGGWLAGLWASESRIYGRFGFGIATERAGIEIETARSGFAAPTADPGEIRLVDLDQALRVIPPIFEAAAASWPGMLARDEKWWKYIWHDPKDHRQGRSELLFAVHATGGVDDGYAVYRTRLVWGTGEESEVSVEDLVTTSDAAYAGLWRYLLDIDLMPRLVAFRRPVDEPLRWMLGDRRAVRPRLDEGLWLRLVDVVPALEARRYPADGEVVLDLRDAFCPWNSGRHALAVVDGTGTCGPTSGPPDLALDVADLAAVYLGGVGLSTLARAGRVVENTPGAAARADTLFRGDRAPWCDRIF